MIKQASEETHLQPISVVFSTVHSSYLLRRRTLFGDICLHYMRVLVLWAFEG